MIRSRSSGFTLVEVMIAIGIIAIGLMPALILQNMVLTRVNRMGMHLHRIFIAKQFMFTAREKRGEGVSEFYLEDQEPYPKTKLLYRAEPVDGEPRFDGLRGLYSERVVLSWQEGTERQRDNLVSFGFEPVRERKKK